MSYITTKNQYLLVNNQKIAYRELGIGKSALPLVMLTHLAATLDQWDPKLIDRLAENQHVVLLDLPGVGASQGQVAPTIPDMAKQAISIIEAMEYQKIHLLGLSMGGMVAQEIVRSDSKLVDHLILVGTAPRAGLGINRVTGTTFRHIIRAILHGTDPKRYIFYGHDKHGKDEAEKVLNRLASRPKSDADKNMSVHSFLRQLKAIKRWGKAQPDDLCFITQPTLIVNGDKDRMVPTENSYRMHEKIASSKLIIYPNSGHGSLFQYAEQFANDLLTFLMK